MKKQQALFTLTVLAIGLGLDTPALADPPPWAPAHGHRAKKHHEYHYVYYPERQVYYAPATQTWFWLNGGNWQVGVNLPQQYRVYTTEGVPVVLQSNRPYVEHVYVEEHYGRPWREKHGHKGKHKHHKHKHDD